MAMREVCAMLRTAVLYILIALMSVLALRAMCKAAFSVRLRPTHRRARRAREWWQRPGYARPGR